MLYWTPTMCLIYEHIKNDFIQSENRRQREDNAANKPECARDRQFAMWEDKQWILYLDKRQRWGWKVLRRQLEFIFPPLKQSHFTVFFKPHTITVEHKADLWNLCKMDFDWNARMEARRDWRSAGAPDSWLGGIKCLFRMKTEFDIMTEGNLSHRGSCFKLCWYPGKASSMLSNQNYFF